MNRASLILSFIILLLLSTSGFSSAQSISVDSLDQDTTVIDERKSTFGQNVISPTSFLEPLAYSRFINAQFDASAIFKKNREYTKVEIATIVEKDGSASISSLRELALLPWRPNSFVYSNYFQIVSQPQRTVSLYGIECISLLSSFIKRRPLITIKNALSSFEQYILPSNP